MRFIIIILLLILSFFFLYRSCIVATENTDTSYKAFLDQALNKYGSKKPQDQSISFSLGEFFDPESHISLAQKHQLSLRQARQSAFFKKITETGDNSSSLQKTEEDIEQELQRERNKLSIGTTSGRKNLGSTQANTNITSNKLSSRSFRGECTGLIYDPCIVLGQDVPPKGIMQFGSWRGKL